jgi:Na+-transporting methylmalonyl-CoA/oxaloacetate decarboxylase gamma subunit
MCKALAATAVVLFLGLVAYLVYLMSGANRRQADRCVSDR